MFPQIAGIFYAVFDPEVGPRTRCQVPDGLIISTATSEVEEPLVSFEAIRNYVIPKPALCNRLVTLRVKNYWLVGYPVCIPGSDYARNSFTFNFVFIFPAGGTNDPAPFESAITRTAKTFKALEEQSRYLSNPDNVYDIDSCIEQMYQDINSFSECQIPIDRAGSNKIDIKLFPILEAPPSISPHHVPVATVKLTTLVDDTWDPTISRIIPFINGYNSVRRIADLADADYEVAKECVQHLMHYECVVIIGLLQFSNVYAATPDVVNICDPEIYRDFLSSVYHPLSRTARSVPAAFRSHRTSGVGSTGTGPSSLPARAASSGSVDGVLGASLSNSDAAASSSVGTTNSMGVSAMELRHGGGPIISMAQALRMYTSFQQGTNLYNWYNEHREFLHDVDIRRFIFYGLLKQFIYRVYAWPIYMPARSSPPTSKRIGEVLESLQMDASQENIALIERCFTKPQHLDFLCTELRAPGTKVSKLLRSLGEWNVVYS